jgi:hypothetical protein
MIAHKKEFSLGAVMFAGFWALFFVLMSPVFGGKNLLDYMDNLYNMISKSSANYIATVRGKAAEYNGNQVTFTIKAKGEQAARVGKVFEAGGATVAAEGEKLKVTGDLGAIAANILDDAEAMLANDGNAISAKYGAPEKLVMFDTYNALKSAQKDLNTQTKFKEAKLMHNLMGKALEPAYNYYGVQSVPIKDKWGTVVISLVGYVIYTLWFGFAILFMFEGWGLKLEH